jgi:carbamoyltransferase
MDKFERLLETHVAFSPSGVDFFKSSADQWAGHKLQLPDRILKGLGPTFGGQLFLMNHHESHAASALFPSPFDEAAILIMDAVGEWSTSSIGYGHGNEIRLTHEMRFPHSLGML